jgi:hypothetical protein
MPWECYVSSTPEWIFNTVTDTERQACSATIPAVMCSCCSTTAKHDWFHFHADLICPPLFQNETQKYLSFSHTRTEHYNRICYEHWPVLKALISSGTCDSIKCLCILTHTVRLSEQTQFTSLYISLYSINWLVCFVTQTECVYCAVRAGTLTI